MRYLLDTGVLLRLVNRQAVEHAEVRSAVRLLKVQGHETVVAWQNLAEFWNVCTRPAEARGGLGLTIEESVRRLRTIERVTTRLPDPADAYSQWRELVIAHGVRGVQVHDAKLVAWMRGHGVQHLLSLNPRDFGRFDGLTVVTPEAVVRAGSP